MTLNFNEDVELYKQIVGSSCCNVYSFGTNCDIKTSHECKKDKGTGCVSVFGRKHLIGITHHFKDNKQALDTMNYVLYILKLPKSKYCKGISCVECAWLNSELICRRTQIRHEMHYDVDTG